MTVRMVVVADTHVPQRGSTLPRALLKALERADVIAHLGDFTSRAVLTALRTYAPVHAVHGNNDETALVAELPLTVTLTVEGKQIVLIHGHVGGRTALQAAQRAASHTPKADAILFGHSHSSFSEVQDGKLLFNPGSPTDRRWAPYRSFGSIEIGESLVPEITIIE